MSETMVAVKVPVPPDPILENAIGYRGQARWMAAWWEPAGDELMVSDGQVSMTGEWEAWLLYVRRFDHLLRDYNLGNSDQVAQHWLVIDREERKAYIAEMRAARAFLAEQWPRHKMIHMTEAQWKELNEQLARELQAQMPTVDEVVAHWEQQRAAVAALRAWLNRN